MIGDGHGSGNKERQRSRAEKRIKIKKDPLDPFLMSHPGLEPGTT